jgi:hypothetical protein
MMDEYLIGMRYASTVGEMFDKRYIRFNLEHGTPTPGLDALSTLLNAIEENVSQSDRRLWPGSYVKIPEIIGAS